MDEKSKRPDTPLVPLNAPLLAANIALLYFSPNTGSFSLQLFDQRFGPVNQIGEEPKLANFEIGRFDLTPRAIRLLEQSLQAALRSYRESLGQDVKTIPQFDASGAMPGLQNLLQQPPPGDNACDT